MPFQIWRGKVQICKSNLPVTIFQGREFPYLGIQFSPSFQKQFELGWCLRCRAISHLHKPYLQFLEFELKIYRSKLSNVGTSNLKSGLRCHTARPCAGASRPNCHAAHRRPALLRSPDGLVPEADTIIGSPRPKSRAPACRARVATRRIDSAPSPPLAGRPRARGRHHHWLPAPRAAWGRAPTHARARQCPGRTPDVPPVGDVLCTSAAACRTLTPLHCLEEELPSTTLPHPSI